MAHTLNFELLGDDLQLLKIKLQPGEAVVAESGRMISMGPDVHFRAAFGGGRESGVFGKLAGAGRRMLSQQSIFVSEFVNDGHKEEMVTFGAPYAGKIINFDLDEYPHGVLCQKGSFLCATEGTNLKVDFTKKLGTALFGGEGFVLERFEGNGDAFIHVGGSVIEYDLAEGEKLQVDTGCLAALEGSVDFDITAVKGVTTMMFGGEGVFLAQLTGPGKVWVQSLPFSEMVGHIEAHLPKQQ